MNKTFTTCDIIDASSNKTQYHRLNLTVEAENYKQVIHEVSTKPPTVPSSPTLATLPRLACTRSSSLPHIKKIRQPLPVPPLPDVVYNGSITSVMAEQLSDIDLEDCDANGENAFFVCDLAEIYRSHLFWQKEMAVVSEQSTEITAFYAVKCNPDPTVVRLLGALGLGFDCASQAEIELVLSLGISPSRIIYANPCKAASFIRHAAACNVRLMTFDNFDELNKVARYHSSAQLVLRILADDEGSLCRFGAKFGAAAEIVPGLLKRAKELKLDVVGVSFHVGSGCTNPLLYEKAIAQAKWAFGLAEQEGFKMTLLDIGGGFEAITFKSIAQVVRRAVDTYFPKESGVKIIAEPGRFFVSEAFELATNIIARRGLAEEEDIPAKALIEGEETPVVMYYVNDGVYGAFNCILFDHQVVHPEILTLGHSLSLSSTRNESWEPSSIWGPTCDSIDLVSKCSTLPTDQLQIGDWLRWPTMGAYTICAASQFNGFRKSLVYYTIDAKGDNRVGSLLFDLLQLHSA